MYNTIIIGAGLAGLTAAKRLTEQGYSVLLLEARDRLGGRIHTLTHGSDPIELGALYLHGRGTAENPNPLIPLFQTFKIESKPISAFKSDTFDTAAKSCSLKELFQNLQPHFNDANRLIQAAKRIQGKSYPSLSEVLLYKDQSIPTLDSPEYWTRKLITATLVHHIAASIKDISILNLIYQAGYEGESEIIINGYQKLTQGLFEQCKKTGNLTLNLKAVVREIHQGDNTESLRIITQNGKEYTGETVISAVPLGIIKNGSIKFTPPLSKEKKQALQHVKIGKQNRIILEFEKPFWPEGIHYIYPNDPDINFWPEYINLSAFSTHHAPRLMANYYAEKAEFVQRDEKEWVQGSLEPLRKTYGKNIPKPTRTIVSHWDTDPYTLGSSTYCGTQCTEQDLDNLSEPEGRLYFAGDYTQRGLQASLNGAYESGLKAALEIEVLLNHDHRKGIRPK